MAISEANGRIRYNLLTLCQLTLILIRALYMFKYLATNSRLYFCVWNYNKNNHIFLLKEAAIQSQMFLRTKGQQLRPGAAATKTTIESIFTIYVATVSVKTATTTTTSC